MNTWLIIKSTILKFHNITIVWITKNLQNLPITTENYDEKNQYLHEMFKKNFQKNLNL